MPIPESGSESDSDGTVDYRDDPATLLALVESSDDVLLQLPDDCYVPDVTISRTCDHGLERSCSPQEII